MLLLHARRITLPGTLVRSALPSTVGNGSLCRLISQVGSRIGFHGGISLSLQRIKEDKEVMEVKVDKEDMVVMVSQKEAKAEGNPTEARAAVSHQEAMAVVNQTVLAKNATN